MSWLDEAGLRLPAEWTCVRLSEVADVLFSNVDKHTFDEEAAVRLCNYVDVYKNDRITSAISFMQASATFPEIKRFQIRPGDVLVTKDSETPDDIAIPALVSEHLPGVLCGYHLAMIRPRSSRVRGDFLFWLHASKLFRGQHEREALGVTRFGLSQHSFLVARLPLPPAVEQDRVAAYLDASCRAIDAAVAKKRRQIQVLSDVLQSAISRAVTQGLDEHTSKRMVDEDWLVEIPSHWRVVRIKRLLLRLDYGISESTSSEGRFPVLKMGHIQNGEIDYAKLDFVDSVAHDLVLEKDDILYNRTNSPDQVGKAAIFRKSKEEGITFASYLVRLRFNHKANPEFMNLVLNSDAFLSFVRRMAIPSVQQSNLNSTRYGRMLVPLPPREEQLKIVEYLQAKSEAVNAVRAKLEQQIETLTAYRKSLIHECVTGQRRITDEDVNRVTAHAAQLAHA